MNTEDILARLNLQQIRNFLLYGAECLDPGPSDYDRRIEEVWRMVDEALKEKFPEKGEYEKMTNRIHSYASVAQEAYMELGMQCGAVLAAQLLIGGRPCA